GGSGGVLAQAGRNRPSNGMSPPCRLEESPGSWRVVSKGGEELRITIENVLHDSTHELGIDPGLTKDGVEAHLQELLAAQVHLLGAGWRLVRREYPTAIGPVDLMCRDEGGAAGARRGQGPGRHGGGGTAHPLPGTAQPGSGAEPGAGRVRGPGDQAAGPGAGRGPGHPLRHPGLRRDAWHRTRGNAVLSYRGSIYIRLV